MNHTFFGHPRGLATLFFTEMFERFTYYGMRPLLILFMTAACPRPADAARLVQLIGHVPMRVINFSEARNNLKTVIDSVVADADVAVISRRDAPDAVVMSLDTFNSMVETVHLLKVPANAAHLARSIEQFRKGRVKPRKLVDA